MLIVLRSSTEAFATQQIVRVPMSGGSACAKDALSAVMEELSGCSALADQEGVLGHAVVHLDERGAPIPVAIETSRSLRGPVAACAREALKRAVDRLLPGPGCLRGYAAATTIPAGGISREAPIGELPGGRDSTAEGAACAVVEVVDNRGRPIRGATVSFAACDTEAEGCPNPWPTWGQWETNRFGRVCAEELLSESGALDITPPEELGGWCAGLKHQRYKGPGTTSRKPSLVRAILNFRALPHGVVRGRVLSVDRRPIGGATVGVFDLVVNKDCTLAPNVQTTTAADGSFVFPRVLRGRAKLRIRHPRYASREIEMAVPGPSTDVTLDEGASWRGRVVDPDGAVVQDCTVALEVRGDTIARSECAGTGFLLEHLSPGDGALVINAGPSSGLGRRLLSVKVHLDAGGEKRDEVIWPAGATISGQVVTKEGAPVSGARLTALPKGKTRYEASRPHPDEVIVEADAEGHFSFRHLAAGVWVVEGDLRAPQRTKIDVSSGSTGIRFVVPVGGP